MSFSSCYLLFVIDPAVLNAMPNDEWKITNGKWKPENTRLLINTKLFEEKNAWPASNNWMFRGRLTGGGGTA
jgi:hypothetical protein